MKLTRAAERRYVKEHLRAVRHITLDPKGPGVIRVHMIPPSSVWDRSVPYLLILNGSAILPVGISWAILLNNFIIYTEPMHGKPIPEKEWDSIVEKAVADTVKIYPSMKEHTIRRELTKMLETLSAAARGKPLPGRLRAISFAEYAGYMTAPHRMDLMISAMEKDGHWNCNQKCLHCYAAGQCGSSMPELSTAEWKQVIDACRKANIPQLTFTGGEPTLRGDLVELVAHAEWFVTRLNTNGQLLTPGLCRELYDASLDSVQVTLYSSDRDVHNTLVGAEGFDRTVTGIRNAVAAGLNVSVNTPLCSLNRNYTATLAFICSLGVKYVTCSGLIPSGGALTEQSKATALTDGEMDSLLTEAVAYCKEHETEISFTSPGWLTPKRLKQIGLTEIPACGACLSNMAVRPDGEVIPCQSWLSGKGLGNILKTPFRKIWKSAECVRIRRVSAKTYYYCQLRTPGENGQGGDK